MTKAAEPSSKQSAESKGLILVVVIGLLAILAVLAAFFLKQSRSHKQVSNQAVLSSQAKLLAQSGIQEAISKLKQIHLFSDQTPDPLDFKFFGDAELSLVNSAPIYEFGVVPTYDLSVAPYPSFAVTDEATALPLSLTIQEDGQSLGIGFSGSFDGTFVDQGNIYSLKVVDAQSKLNINDTNQHMARLINELCVILYYDEDFDRDGTLDAANEDPNNNHLWDFTTVSEFNPQRPYTEDQDENGLIEANEDLNDDGILQSGLSPNPGRGPDLAWDNGSEITSAIGTYLTAYLRRVLRQGDFFHPGRFSTWADIEQALIWAQENPTLSGWVAAPGGENNYQQAPIRQAVLDQLRPYITLHSWQDRVVMPIGLGRMITRQEDGSGLPTQTEFHGRVARGDAGLGTIKAATPDTTAFSNAYGGPGSWDVPPATDTSGIPVPVLGVGSEVYAWREMLPRDIKMVQRAPININTAPIHLLIALFKDLDGYYLEEEPAVGKPDPIDITVAEDDVNDGWLKYFHDSRYEANHWYRWLAPLYFTDDDQANNARGDRDDGAFVGIGRIHKSHPLSLTIATNLAYTIECLRRGQEDLNHNGRLDQDYDTYWNNVDDGNDADLNYSNLITSGTHPRYDIDEFEDSAADSGLGNQNLQLDAPFSTWIQFKDFVHKILPDERYPEDLGGGQWHPHGDINRNGVLDDDAQPNGTVGAGLGNENRIPMMNTISWNDQQNDYGGLASGDLSYVQKDVILSNFDPNLHLNELNPDRLLARYVDKCDLNTYSTEFCFESRGVFEIDCVARILDQENKVMAKKSISQVVEIFRIYKEDTQKEFLGHQETLGWNDLSHSVQGIFSPNNRTDLDPSAFTVGSSDPSFPNGQALMSFPEVQRHDHVVGDPSVEESGCYYEGYLGLASTAIDMDVEKIRFWRDVKKWDKSPYDPAAVSRFFDDGVALSDGTLLDQGNINKLGPIERNGDAWSRRGLIPKNRYLNVEDPSQAASRHFADGVYSEAGGVLEFPWNVHPNNPYFDIRNGGGVMFWVKPSWRPEFAEKVRNFFSLSAMGSGSFPGPSLLSQSDSIDSSIPGQNFYFADPSQIYYFPNTAEKLYIKNQDLGYLDAAARTTEDMVGRISYDITNEYGVEHSMGVVPFGCYFQPNHHGSYAGWSQSYYLSDPTLANTLSNSAAVFHGRRGGAFGENVNPGNYFPYESGQSRNYFSVGTNKWAPSAPTPDEYHLFRFPEHQSHTVEKFYPLRHAEDGLAGRTHAESSIDYLYSNVDPRPVPGIYHPFSYPTFRRAQQVRGLRDAGPNDFSLYTGPYFHGGMVNPAGGDPNSLTVQRDNAFGVTEKTGRSLGWGCGFTPRSFSINIETPNNFAGGVLSANLHPRLKFTTIDLGVEHSHPYKRIIADNDSWPCRYNFMFEKGKWAHIALLARLDPNPLFLGAGTPGAIHDMHPPRVTIDNMFITYDPTPDLGVDPLDHQDWGKVVTPDLLFPISQAPLLQDGLDFLPSTTTLYNGVHKVAPKTGNYGLLGPRVYPQAQSGSYETRFLIMEDYFKGFILCWDQDNPGATWPVMPINTPPDPPLTSMYRPWRASGFFSNSDRLMRTLSDGHPPGGAFTTLELGTRRMLYNQYASNVHIGWDYETNHADNWPTANYSPEVDYVLQMYINGLSTNQGNHWRDWQRLLDTTHNPHSNHPGMYLSNFSRGYAEGDLSGPTPLGAYTNFFDSGGQSIATLRFGEDAADHQGQIGNSGPRGANYPADATFRNIVFLGSDVADPDEWPGGYIRNTGNDDARWSFDYRPILEHYWRGTYYAGSDGMFISQALDPQALDLSYIESQSLVWGKAQVNLVVPDYTHINYFRSHFGVRDNWHNLPYQDGDYSDYAGNNVHFDGGDTDPIAERGASSLPTAFGYAKWTGGFLTNAVSRISGHEREIAQSKVSFDIVNALNLWTEGSVNQLSDRRQQPAPTRIIDKDSGQALSYSSNQRYRLQLDLHEKNPNTDHSNARYFDNDREKPVLESPFIDDVTLTYSTGTKVLYHLEDFNN